MKAKSLSPVFLCAALLAGVCLSAHASIAEHVTRTMAAGIDLLTYPMGVKDVVTIQGSLPAGDSFAAQEGGNPTVPTLTGMLLDKGTTHEDKFAIAKQLDDVGARLSFRVGAQMVQIQGQALKADLPRLIRILAEELRAPAFSAEEFAKAKKQLTGHLRKALEDTDSRAREAFLLTVYPKGHPNRPTPIAEQIAAVDLATLDDVKRFYRQHYGPAHLRLVFVGDVDSRAIRSEVVKAFSGWTGGVEAVCTISGASVPGPREQRIPMADKTSVSVLIGETTGLRYQDTDSIPLRVGTAILGSGFTGRLMHTVRDKEGLTYSIGAGLDNDTFLDGTFAVTASFAPTLMDRGIASARSVLQKWWQDGVTADELTARKTNLVGTYQVSLSSTQGMATTILDTLERGKPLSWLDDYTKAIDSLTVDEVDGAMKRHLDPDRAVLVEAGSFAAK
jgi:zinc protease